MGILQPVAVQARVGSHIVLVLCVSLSGRHALQFVLMRLCMHRSTCNWSAILSKVDTVHMHPSLQRGERARPENIIAEPLFL